MPSLKPQQVLEKQSFPGHVLTEEQMTQHAKVLKDQVVVVTGAGSGFGKGFSILAAKYGAKIVASDIGSSVQATVDTIKANGGQAIATTCDVTNWDSQVAMFRLGVKTYGQIDVVVPNAGVTEAPGWFEDKEQGGEPSKPNMGTFNVNLLGAMYTVKLGFHHLRRSTSKHRSIVLLGSMSSFSGIPLAPMYTLSKHAMLGLMRSVYHSAKVEGININIIAPWFVETGILTVTTRLAIAGLPLGTVSDVTLAMLKAASDPDLNGHILSVDPDGVLSIGPDCMGAGENGYYGAFERRAAGAIKTEKLVRDIVTAFRTPSITRTASPSIKALLVALKAVVITYLVRGAGVQSLRGITLQSIQGLKSEQVLQVGVVARALAAVVVAFW